MTQSTQNRFRKKQRKATAIAAILVITILILAGLLLYIVLGKRSDSKADASNVSTETIYGDIEAPLEITTPEVELSITVSVVGDCCTLVNDVRPKSQK